MSMDMPIDIRQVLSQRLPDAIAWAEQQSKEAAAIGDPLTGSLITIARAVGVQHPEQIRIAILDSLPLPLDPILRAAALQMGLLGPEIVGLTFGHSVLIRRGYDSDPLRTPRLLSHEFRHVHQYETYGSIAAYLRVYLPQIVEHGYDSAPLEIDARLHEQSPSLAFLLRNPGP